MSLIAILIGLITERFLGSMEEFRRFDWFRRYLDAAQPRLARWRWLNGAVGTLLLLLPVLLPVALADFLLARGWFLPEMILAVVVLLFSFGPSDLEAEVEAYIDAQERGDEESACWHASELLGEHPPQHSALVTRAVIENTLVEANERLLGVLLWFLLLGPAGALLYRLSALLSQHNAGRDDGVAEAGLRLHAILAWLPARMCALAYALAGSFVDALRAWRQQEGDWLTNNRNVMIATGLGALGIEDGEENSQPEHDTAMVSETLALVRRAVLVFLSIVALFTLAGWMA